MKYIAILLLLTACSGGNSDDAEKAVREAAAKRGLEIGAVDCYECGAYADWCRCQVTAHNKPYTIFCTGRGYSNPGCGAFQLSVTD